MEAEKTSYRPFKFLDRMEGKNHIVLLYDSRKYADLIIARYFFNGLKNSCCHFIHTLPFSRILPPLLFAGRGSRTGRRGGRRCW